MNCKDCGKLIDDKSYMNGLCSSCYSYRKKGGTFNPPAEAGRIEHDVNGRIICHICGRAYNRLGSHIRESHKLKTAEYKRIYGLCANAQLTSLSYHDKMSVLAIQNEMPEQLKTVGIKTRVKKGEKKLRYGKKSRLQECIDRSNRMKGSVI